MTELNISLPPPKDHPDFDGWLIQVTQYLRDYLDANVNFVDRGDPAAADFTQANLTADGTWKTGASALDFSAIVPSGARAMILRVALTDDAINTQLLFKKSGQTNNINVGQIYTQVANQCIVTDSMILPCSSNRKVDYAGSNTVIDSIVITVRGWFI